MKRTVLTPGLQAPRPEDVPEGWRLCRLGDVASFRGGGRLGLTKERDYRDEGFPAFSAAGQDGFVDIWEFERNAVIVPSIGSIGRAYRAEGRWLTLANTQIIFPDESQLSHAYLHHRLDGQGFFPVSGTAQPFIKPSDFEKCWIVLPPREEQDRIVEALDTIDEAIALHREAIEKIKQIKAGLASDLLTGALRVDQPGGERL